MKSKASIKGHPIHPILIVFPIAFFTGSLLFDVLAGATFNPNFRFTAKYLEIAGIIAGLLAAIPGLIDFSNTLPPNSSAKKRGAKHGITNTCAIILFAVALGLRSKEVNIWIIAAIEFIGVILLAIAGWMGGTLVYRNMIGVYNRYAAAGKWKEVHAGNKAGKIEVAKTDELKTDQMVLVFVNNKRIVVAHTESGFVAFDDRCTHKGGSLAGGTMICGTVQCPWHGSQFDVNTGTVKAGPAKDKINTWQVTEEAGKVYLVI